jgi:HEAT repeat protein
VGEISLLGESETFPLDDVFVALTVVEEIHRPSARDEMYGLMDAALRRQRAVFADARANDDAAELPPAPGERPAKKELRVVKPEELLKPGVRAVVAGAPGCGKTTLLRWLANRTLKADSRLPIFIELKFLKETAFDGDKTLEDVLYDAVGVQFLNAGGRLPKAACTAFRFHLNEKLRTGEVAIFLDGLDEIRERKIFDPLRAAVEAFLASAAKDAGLVVSTRPYAVQSAFAGGLEEMEIAPLDAKQIEAFLTRYFGDHADATARLRERLQRERPLADLARIPFLLGAMAGLFARGGGTATERLTLYGEIVRDLAGRMDDKKKVFKRFRVDDPDGETKREFLEEFACARLFDAQEADVARRLIFTGEDLKKFARRHCAARSYLAEIKPNLLAADVKATPLLREVGTDAYAFVHLTLQEYLAAVGLTRRDDAKETLCKAIFNPTLAAMEVLPMALGLAERPDELYAALEDLPESLDFVNLRVRARGLAYAGDKLAQVRIDALANRFMKFFHNEIAREESPYGDVVTESFANAAGRAQRALTDRLLAALRDDDWNVRRKAAAALVKLGAATPDVTAFWIAALRAHDGDVRRDAAQALGELGAATPDVTDALLAALRDDNWYVRQNAAEALVKLGTATPDVTDALLAALRDGNYDVRLRAAEALGKLGAASSDVVSGLLAALRDNSPHVRRCAAWTLGELGAATSDVTDALLAALRDDKDEQVRRIAAQALGKLGAATPDVTAFWLGALHDGDLEMQRYAVQALPQNIVVPKLLSVLEKDNWRVRVAAAAALGELGATGCVKNPIDQVLIQLGLNFGLEGVPYQNEMRVAMDDNPYRVRWRIAQAVGTFDNWAPSVARKLLETLRDENQHVRAAAAAALGEVGVTMEDIVRGLRTASNDGDSDVRQAAAGALVRLGMDSDWRANKKCDRRATTRKLEGWHEAVAILLAALRNDGNTHVRRRAAEALGKLGGATSDVMTGLLTALRDDKDHQVRRYAAQVLGELGAASSDVTAGLTAALRDDDEDVRREAARTLKRLEAAIDKATGGLRSRLWSAIQYAWRITVKVLSEVESPALNITDGMIAMLDSDNENIRRDATETLGKLGRPTDKVLEALFGILENKNSEMRCKSTQALCELDAATPEVTAGLGVPPVIVQKHTIRSIFVQTP